MADEQWPQVKQLFQTSLEREPGERAAFLREASGGDEALRREVESLLASHNEAEAFLELSAFEVATKALGHEPDEVMVGRRIGPYKILRQIGRGGMGTVYLAARADEQYRKQVALKVIKRGMDTDSIIDRFRHERQILANLEHPNIARLIDGGTTADSLPFFVMEYVEGRPLGEYCDSQKLSTTERLTLFRTVCAAIHYAHQNLVIHLDIKPGNILVTSEGVPKLLDFGVAKLLKAESPLQTNEATATALRAMTPEYASPEQVRGDRITTASDIYSLGVLLYELLTGHHPYPFRTRDPHEITQAICEREPEKPSTIVGRVDEVSGMEDAGQTAPTPEQVSSTRDGTLDKLRRRLRGDLDNIVLMALRKVPERRYASVEQFSEDVRCHLDGQPVIAHHDTLWYRSAKFVRRNRVAVAAAALVVATLVGGIVTTTWQARLALSERARAEMQRARAERRFNDLRSLANSFLFEFHDAIETLPGATPARELLVERALGYLNSLVQEVGTSDVSLQRELATAYERVGRIQGNSYYSNLGDTDGALKSYRQSLEIRVRLGADDPANKGIQSELASSHEGVGDMLYTINDLTGGLRSYERALAIRKALSTTEPANPDGRRALAAIYARLGDISGLDGYPNLGNTEGALGYYRQALTLREDLLAADPENRKARAALAQALSHVGVLLRVTGDTRGAIEHGRKAIRINESLAALEPNNAAYRLDLLSSYNTLRYALVDDGQITEAIGNTRKTITILELLSMTDPENAFARRSLSVSYNALGRDLVKTGDVAGALDNHRLALAISEELAAMDPASAEHSRDVAFTLQRLAEAQAAARDFRAALKSYRQALARQEALLAASPESGRDRDDLATSHGGIGTTLAALGDPIAAEAALRQAVRIAEEVSAQSPTNVGMRRRLAQRYFEFGDLYVQLAQMKRIPAKERDRNWRAARNWYLRSVNVWRALRSQGVLSRADGGKPDEVASAIASCDAALASAAL